MTNRNDFITYVDRITRNGRKEISTSRVGIERGSDSYEYRGRDTLNYNRAYQLIPQPLCVVSTAGRFVWENTRDWYRALGRLLRCVTSRVRGDLRSADLTLGRTLKIYTWLQYVASVVVHRNSLFPILVFISESTVIVLRTALMKIRNEACDITRSRNSFL